MSFTSNHPRSSVEIFFGKNSENVTQSGIVDDNGNSEGGGGGGGGNNGGEVEIDPFPHQIITLSILIFMTICGNCVIIIVLTFTRKFHKHMNRVNIFIINLSVGDLAICFSAMIPELILEVLQEWPFGSIACKLVSYTQTLALASTIYLLMAMSWDRYNAICKPLEFNPSRKKAIWAIVLAWSFAIAFSTPILFIFSQVEMEDNGVSKKVCNSVGYSYPWQKKMYFIWLTISILIIPGVWIAYCYFSVVRAVWRQESNSKMENFSLNSPNKTGNGVGGGGTSTSSGSMVTASSQVISRAKIQTIQMSLTIVLFFIFLWTPYFILYDIHIFFSNTLISDSAFVFVQNLALLNSSVNPLIYSFFYLRNLRIKQGLRDACSCFTVNDDKNPVCKNNRDWGPISTSSTLLFQVCENKESQIENSVSPSKMNTSNTSSQSQSQSQMRFHSQKSRERSYEFSQTNKHIKKKRNTIFKQLQATEGNNFKNYSHNHSSSTSSLNTNYLHPNSRNTHLTGSNGYINKINHSLSPSHNHYHHHHHHLHKQRQTTPPPEITISLVNNSFNCEDPETEHQNKRSKRNSNYFH